MATTSAPVRLFNALTPLVRSEVVGRQNVFYKLELLQPSGSFKYRGMSHMISTLHNRSPISKLICSSGGNAGHAVAVAGKLLKIPVEVFVPTTTLPLMIAKLKDANATVHVGGNNWNEADHHAQIALAASTDAKYIPPFDDPLLWEGHSTIIKEMNKKNKSTRPDAIIASVGGGGLLRGLQLGLHAVGWADKVKLFGVETEGAASFAAAKAAGRPVRLDKIDTVATSLGALQVIPSVLDEATVQTESVVVSDREAIDACLRYAHDSRQLVEPACGAALAMVYTDRHYQQHLADMKKVIVIVCGGGAVSLDMLNQWKQRFDL